MRYEISDLLTELESKNAEIERLCHDIDRHLTICTELEADNERLRAAHKENARLLGLVIRDLQGRVDGGKLAALTQCRDRAEEAYQQKN